MQTAALSRRLRQSVVTKGRCRQAPRQRVASHNTRSCWRPARRCAPGAPWPEPSAAHHAHIHVRASPATSSCCAWTPCTASSRSPPRACTRAAHAYTAACALRAHARRLHPRGRVGLTAARFKPNPNRCRGKKRSAGNNYRGDPNATGPSKCAGAGQDAGKSVTVGAPPRHPVCLRSLPLPTRCHRSRRGRPAEAEPDACSAAPCCCLGQTLET